MYGTLIESDGNVATVASVATSVAANVAANIAAANTAFLTPEFRFRQRSGLPYAQSAGRGCLDARRGRPGRCEERFIQRACASGPPGTTLVTGSEPCSTVVRASFDGIQLGSDIARLNINGWNLHVGATAGSLYLNNSIVDGAPLAASFTGNTTVQVPFDSSSQVPFIGAYATATNGGFFADLLIRGDAYRMIESPGLNFYNQNINARDFPSAAQSDTTMRYRTGTAGSSSPRRAALLKGQSRSLEYFGQCFAIHK